MGHLRTCRPRLGKQTPQDQADIVGHLQPSLSLGQGPLQDRKVLGLELSDFGLEAPQHITLLA